MGKLFALLESKVFMSLKGNIWQLLIINYWPILQVQFLVLFSTLAILFDVEVSNTNIPIISSLYGLFRICSPRFETS